MICARWQSQGAEQQKSFCCYLRTPVCECAKKKREPECTAREHVMVVANLAVSHQGSPAQKLSFVQGNVCNSGSSVCKKLVRLRLPNRQGWEGADLLLL